MDSWWNSLDRVSHINTYVLGFAALFGFITAVLIIAGWFFGNRVSDLQQTQLTEFRTEADTKIAAANQIAAQANEHAKQLGKETEELRNQNLELQRRISPRFLTKSEEQQIFASVNSFHGHQIIITKLGDGEAGPYGDSIIAVFKRAGWIVQTNSIGTLSPPTYGVVCDAAANPDNGIKALIAAFERANIKLTVRVIPAPSSNAWVEMIVGLKPIN